MVTVAIFSADPVLRRNLEQLPRDDPAVVIVGMVDQPSTLRELFNRDRVDVLLADVPPRELLPVYRSGNNIALVVLLDGPNAEDTARALSAGARAPSSIVRPGAMKSSQPSRRLSPGWLSSRPTPL
jgi:DNA-binding NarL/FixJ family response regulator